MVERRSEVHDWDMETTQRTTSVQDLDIPVRRRPAADADPAAALAQVRHEAFQLPVLRQGPSPRALPATWQEVTLRLQAALWEVAARADVPVTPGASIDEVARLLVGYGAVIPPAGDAVRLLAAVAVSGCDADPAPAVSAAEAAPLAERLSGYLALRARFG